MLLVSFLASFDNVSITGEVMLLAFKQHFFYLVFCQFFHPTFLIVCYWLETQCCLTRSLVMACLV